VTRNPIDLYKRWAERPPGGDLRLLRDRKIATRLKRDGAESLGFVARVADGDNTAHELKKYLFVVVGLGLYLIPDLADDFPDAWI
jgi:hypothetical protein